MTDRHATAVVIDGTACAARVCEEVARDVVALIADTGNRLGLATVLIGADAASPKDVDGLSARSVGLLAQGREGLRPCTPAGVVRLLDDHGMPLRGVEVVVVGRSELVGKPLAQLLLARDATVTVCHSHTADLAATCRRADVVVAAAGVPRLIGADAVRAGAVVIDVGIHREDGVLCGDVDFGPVAQRAGHISPVPGGVGPMTIAMLLANTALAARRQCGA